LGRFEYDFRLLAAAAALYFTQSVSVEEAARRAVYGAGEGESPERTAAIDRAYEAYTCALQQVPPLFPDTIDVLTSVRMRGSSAGPVATVLFSDGDPERLERILEAYAIRPRGFFDEIVIGTKSRAAFEQAKEAGKRHLPAGQDRGEPVVVVVGDSLRREIKFGNQAGFVTVYKPAGFLGREQPGEPDEHPAYTIENLGRLLPVLEDLCVLGR